MGVKSPEGREKLNVMPMDTFLQVAAHLQPVSTNTDGLSVFDRRVEQRLLDGYIRLMTPA
jgi:hypothetical protein